MGCRLAAYVDELAVAVVRSDAVLHKAAEGGAVGRQDSKCQVVVVGHGGGAPEEAVDTLHTGMVVVVPLAADTGKDMDTTCDVVLAR